MRLFRGGMVGERPAEVIHRTRDCATARYRVEWTRPKKTPQLLNLSDSVAQGMRPVSRAFYSHLSRPFFHHPSVQRPGPILAHIRHAPSVNPHVLTISQPWLRLNCSLGEGPFWEDDTNTLRFLDVEKQKVHRVDLNVGPSSHKVVKEFDISIGCVKLPSPCMPDHR
jgi:hypothetical protein